MKSLFEWKKKNNMSRVTCSHWSDCWFSVSDHSNLIKTKIKTVQKIKSGIWEKNEGKYSKILAKIQVTAISLKQDMGRNV